MEESFKVFINQPLARRFVYYEWFYSSIDKCILVESNDFIQCLNEFFPNIACSKMTRKQWAFVRKKFGKPRRCSKAFFNEERIILGNKRHQIRALQNKKTSEFSLQNNFIDIPEQIPLSLVVESPVLVHLIDPNDSTWGLFTGKVDAVDSLTSSYRINFDDPSIPNLYIQDIDIMSLDSFDTIYVSSLFVPTNNMQNHENLKHIDKGYSNSNDFNGINSAKLLSIVKLEELIELKRKLLKNFCNYNDKAEKMTEFDIPFGRLYASNMLRLDRINQNMSEHLTYLFNVNSNQKNHNPDYQLNNPKKVEETKAFSSAFDTLVNMDEFKQLNNQQQFLITLFSSVIQQIRLTIENDVSISFNNFLEMFEKNLSPESIEYFKSKLYPYFKLFLLTE